ncbi:MAG: hypothetical protein HY738_20205 [Bacteroidia bacterium]|nr:hypothetical protein [Bacteroidia bacterium]
MIILFFLITLPFLLYMLKAGEKISSHSYYAIPYIPLMALIASYLLDSVKIRWVAIILISIVLIENILNRYIDFRIKDTELYKLEIETIADRFTKRNDIIAINGGFSPQDIYFTHRKGWTLQNEEIINTHIISELKAKNCKFLFINKHRFISKVPDLKYQKLFENEDYCIYRL